jgi:hypothetical protein
MNFKIIIATMTTSNLQVLVGKKNKTTYVTQVTEGTKVTLNKEYQSRNDAITKAKSYIT